MIQTLSRIAIEGIDRYYRDCPEEFHYTVRRNPKGQMKGEGESIRYAAICQIGISRWLKYHPDDATDLPDLYARISGNISRIDDVGDAALWVWAACEGQGFGLDAFVQRMKHLWPRQVAMLHAVELAWVLKACVRVHDTSVKLREQVLPILEEARQRLDALFHEQSSLFLRHRRAGFGQRLSGAIACFADQVYPIVALSDAADTLGDTRSKEMAERTVSRICELQGPLGQWLWHYDVPRNRVSEPYPVFSVHQHGMAPMALLACDAVTGQDHRAAIEKGLHWIWGRNELNQDLVLPEEGIIWRDIERREPEKLSRKVKAACNVMGIRRLGDFLCAPFRGFKVNHECRPYELGWILYAWADQVGWKERDESREREHSGN